MGNRSWLILLSIFTLMLSLFCLYQPGLVSILVYIYIAYLIAEALTISGLLSTTIPYDPILYDHVHDQCKKRKNIWSCMDLDKQKETLMYIYISKIVMR